MPKKATSVTLETEVIAYIDELALRDDRTRSYVLNAIIREHALKNGKTLSTGNNSGRKPVHWKPGFSERSPARSKD
jgi:predicted DNA-binding protein